MIQLEVKTSFSTNVIDLKAFTFNGGEEHLKLPAISFQGGYEDGLTFVVKVIRPTSQTLMQMMLLTDAIARRYADVNTILYIPYLPYARQDRVCNPGEAHSLKVVCDIINYCEFDKVVCVDLHSDVAEALIDNLKHVTQANVLQHFKSKFTDYYAIICPDAGASKKIYAAAKALGIPNIIFCDKVRDTKTGEILKTIVHEGDFIAKHHKLLIVDDICDGGRTFIEIAKALDIDAPDGWCPRIDLFVTHGIFSKGLEALEGIDNIITTDSFCDWQGTNLTVLEIGDV